MNSGFRVLATKFLSLGMRWQLPYDLSTDGVWLVCSLQLSWLEAVQMEPASLSKFLPVLGFERLES